MKRKIKEGLTSYQKSIIRDMAAEDYDCGHPMSDTDALEWFSSGEEKDIPIELASEAADYYFEAFDQVREDDNSDWDEDLDESRKFRSRKSLKEWDPHSRDSAVDDDYEMGVWDDIDDKPYKHGSFQVGGKEYLPPDGYEYVVELGNYLEDEGIDYKILNNTEILFYNNLVEVEAIASKVCRKLGNEFKPVIDKNGHSFAMSIHFEPVK